MKPLQPIVAASLVFALMLMGDGLVAAQSPQQYYGGPGGEVTGYVIGEDRIPVDWAPVRAIDGERVFQAFSGMSGVYQMRVPVGRYNVTVNVPGFVANSAIVNVTENSSSKVNFYLNSISVSVSSGSSSVINLYLEESQVAVPEFQPNALIVIVLALAATLILRRRSSKC